MYNKILPLHKERRTLDMKLKYLINARYNKRIYLKRIQNFVQLIFVNYHKKKESKRKNSSALRIQKWFRRIITLRNEFYSFCSGIYGGSIKQVYFGGVLVDNKELLVTILKRGDSYLLLGYDCDGCEEYELWVSKEILTSLLNVYPFGRNEHLENEIKLTDTSRITQLIIDSLKITSSITGLGESNTKTNCLSIQKND